MVRPEHRFQTVVRPSRRPGTRRVLRSGSAEAFEVERHYRTDSNVLVSEYRTALGRVRVTDSMNSSLAGRLPWCELARRIEGLEGRVTMQATIIFGTRSDTISPWLQPNEHGCILPRCGAGPLP